MVRGKGPTEAKRPLKAGQSQGVLGIYGVSKGIGVPLEARELTEETEMTNLNPKYLRSHVIGDKPLANTVELFLDYNCPFSAKMFKKVQDEILPLLRERKLQDKYRFVFMNVVQPWHGVQSSVLHEVSFAVGRVDPDLFWTVSRVLFDNLAKFLDSEVYDKSRGQLTKEILALIVKETDGCIKTDSFKQIEQLLQVKGVGGPVASNDGSGVISDVKYFTRYHRTVGIHVTPSVMVNGVLVPQIESSTDAAKIIDILESQCN